MPFFSYMSQKYNIEVASKESTSAQKALPATACRAASAFSIPLSLPRHPVHLRFEDFFLSFSIFFFIIIIIFHFLFLISLDLNCFVIPIAVLIPVLSFIAPICNSLLLPLQLPIVLLPLILLVGSPSSPTTHVCHDNPPPHTFPQIYTTRTLFISVI